MQLHTWTQNWRSGATDRSGSIPTSSSTPTAIRCLSRSLDVTLSLRALEMGLAEHVPEIHHSNQGVRYAASDYVKMLKTYQVQISMAVVREPEENGYTE
jgi:transposase InsO family protein